MKELGLILIFLLFSQNSKTLPRNKKFSANKKKTSTNSLFPTKSSSRLRSPVIMLMRTTLELNAGESLNG